MTEIMPVPRSLILLSYQQRALGRLLFIGKESVLYAHLVEGEQIRFKRGLQTDRVGEFMLAETVLRCQRRTAGVGADACLLVVRDHGRFTIRLQLVGMRDVRELFRREV